jgi:Kdo2-lipid IVA lauroyltransferase/acyltransferase
MFIIKLFSKFPLSWLYRLSDLLYYISYYVVRYRRKVVIKNLKAAFPDKALPELRQIEKSFYRNLCDYAVETLRAYSISTEELNERLTFILPDDADFGKTPIIGLASHQFNWEWLMLAGCTQLNMGVDFVYQPLKSKAMNNFMLHLRSRMGGYAVKKNEVGRVALKRKNIVRTIALVADQFPSKPSDKRCWINFLNQETAFYQAIEQLAILTQYPVYDFAIRKIKRGYYECSVYKIATPPYNKDAIGIVGAYVKATEEIIYNEPAGWLWSHMRWKKTKAEMGD